MKEKENTISCNHVSNSHKETADVEGGHAVSQEGHAGPQLLHGENKPKCLCCAKKLSLQNCSNVIRFVICELNFQVYFNWHPGQILRHNFFLGSILPLTKVKRWQAKIHSFLPSDLFLFLIWCCWHLVHGKIGLDWSLRGLTNSCIYAKEKHQRVKGNHRSFQNLKTWRFDSQNLGTKDILM